MGIIIWMVWIPLGILQIVIIIKFFQIATDVRELKNKASLKGQVDNKKEFYKWIVAGETDKAKDALFEAIASTTEFNKALLGVNDLYRLKLQDSLNKEFSKELHIIGIESIDLSAIK